MKGNESRNMRTYRIKDSVYKKAKKRADKDKYPLAVLLEKVAIYYSEGLSIGVFDHSETYASRIQDI